MNFDESPGGSSSKGQENGDDSNGSDRPLKKARFAWQVKGKYHLKNDTNDAAAEATTSTESESTDEEMVAGCSGYTCLTPDDLLNNTDISEAIDPYLDTLGEYIYDQELKNLQYVTGNADESLRRISKIEDFEYKTTRNDSVIGSYEVDSVPMSLVASESYTEDQCIARWQAKQMARGSIDNTINRVLDFCKENSSTPEEEHVAHDVAELIDNLPEDDSIENEGILMAISAHGLQNASNSSLVRVGEFEEHCDAISYDGIPANVELRVPTSQNIESPERYPHDLNFGLNNIDMQWSYSNAERSRGNENSPSPSNVGLPFAFIENLHNGDVASGIINETDNHCDVLDAAVLFAIQSKGLTTFGTDYG
ncbi:hypothetical protein HW555_005785 [Spodoptera exigua]|uniref:Uncharacterized protein n=1 Tax=Spodoptera exigua TaxID=7107 RepID=A0A835GIF7_SPOEX|nr:hypothetical protein HW555_005785 [Spodoptera exigua]